MSGQWRAESVQLSRPVPHVAQVTLRRHAAANAIDVECTRGLQEALRRTEDDAEVRVVLLCSEHPRVFCSGADLSTIMAGREQLLFPEEGGFAGLVQAQRRKPWIAVVDGAAYAGGFELALACDFVLCSPKATFGLPEVSRGLAALAGGVQRLPRRIPAGVALDMILTGQPIDGTRAWELGLASRLSPSDKLMSLALETAAAIAANAPGAVQASLHLAHASLAKGEEWAWARTPEVKQKQLLRTEIEEGIQAFFFKRAPQWENLGEGNAD